MIRLRLKSNSDLDGLKKFMAYLIKHKIVLAIVICLLGSVKTISACDCRIVTTEDAIKQSSVVFSGKVVGFEYRKGIPNWSLDRQAKETGKQIDYETRVVKVQVEQWWKGDVPTEIFLATGSTKSALGTSRWSCDYSFRQGESYLIFAIGDEYRTSECSRIQELAKAGEDLKILGEGKKPIESEDKSNKSPDTNQ